MEFRNNLIKATQFKDEEIDVRLFMAQIASKSLLKDPSPCRQE